MTEQQTAAHRAARALLDDAAAARRAWKAYEPEVPQIIANAHAAGMRVRDIAHAFDMGERYVYRVISETPANLDALDEDAPPVGEYRISTRRDDQ
ncbi:hypothetical protein [Streptomyces sp. NPDC059515]|uniref:hypothetical protein n=1 Tax=Streptomyces sp. NPDC059515 TaxID=3346854 RepID=UPI0036B0A53B